MGRSVGLWVVGEENGHLHTLWRETLSKINLTCFTNLPRASPEGDDEQIHRILMLCYI